MANVAPTGRLSEMRSCECRNRLRVGCNCVSQNYAVHLGLCTFADAKTEIRFQFPECAQGAPVPRKIIKDMEITAQFGALVSSQYRDPALKRCGVTRFHHRTISFEMAWRVGRRTAGSQWLQLWRQILLRESLHESCDGAKIGRLLWAPGGRLAVSSVMAPCATSGMSSGAFGRKRRPRILGFWRPITDGFSLETGRSSGMDSRALRRRSGRLSRK